MHQLLPCSKLCAVKVIQTIKPGLPRRQSRFFCFEWKQIPKDIQKTARYITPYMVLAVTISILHFGMAAKKFLP